MIPKNWRWITLNDFAECLDNLRVPVNAKERSKRIGNIPYYGATGQTGWIDNYLTNEQLVLLGEDGAPFLDIFKDKAYIIDGKAWINNHVHILKSYFGDIGNRYLKYYLNNFDFKDYVSGTTRLKLTQSKMKNIPIPLPPIEEQKRIVDLIESLFSKLDRAKALAQNVIDNYELRRSAILHKAFKGQLTNSNLDNWQEVNLSTVCEINPPKIQTRNLPDKLEVTFLPMTSISAESGKIIEQQRQPLIKVKKGFTNFSEGDVIFAKITPCMENGKSAIIGKLINDIGYGSTEFYVLRCSEKLYNIFLYHLIRSQKFRDEAKSVMAGAVGQQRVPKNFLEEYLLNLPTIEEQKEIARILESLLAKEQRTKKLAEQVLQKIDLMKKAILARAFRGELTLLTH